MNLHLELTKWKGSRLRSDLKNVVGSKGNEKQTFFTGLVSRYKDKWNMNTKQGISQLEWYAHLLAKTKQTTQHGAHEQLYIHAESPMVMGQGEGSVLETHLTLHRLYGVPYLPATALKGVAAHYCDQYLGREDDGDGFRLDGEYHKVLFGSQDQRGLITFHDAFPTLESISDAISIDVLTPHHQNYNLGIKAGDTIVQAPRDDDTPVPVHFLNVKADFEITVSCEQTSETAINWLKIAAELLGQAIEQEGLGGKTNAGYGRFTRKRDEEK